MAVNESGNAHDSIHEVATDAELVAMRRALVLAGHGPVTGGNPQVGCVLIDASGTIVAEGWHHGAGTPHAEIDALAKLATTTGPTAAGLSTAGLSTAGLSTAGLTAVVTLEPCNHTGRTGPCSQALIAAGIRRVVYAIDDPGATSGGGSERLRAAGVSVVSGVHADDVRSFIHPWLTAIRHGRPYVTLKWASSLDGRAAAADGTSQWITGAAARERVHFQRSQSDAILVGTGTVIADNPTLTARTTEGPLPHQPVPVVIGERPIPADAQLHQHPAGLIETGSRDLAAILADLFGRGMRRAYVEGGPTLESALIGAGLVDEYLIYLAPTLLGSGARAGSRGDGAAAAESGTASGADRDFTAIGNIGVTTIGEQRRLDIVSIERLGDDILITARPASTAATAGQRTTNDFPASPSPDRKP
jgi:diaminohydroxyphosphoribosylaminopyrimidine deaminase/5-amino-6-(5-phosphoribosylamino)uracil reductase